MQKEGKKYNLEGCAFGIFPSNSVNLNELTLPQIYFLQKVAKISDGVSSVIKRRVLLTWQTKWEKLPKIVDSSPHGLFDNREKDVI